MFCESRAWCKWKLFLLRFSAVNISATRQYTNFSFFLGPCLAAKKCWEVQLLTSLCFLISLYCLSAVYHFESLKMSSRLSGLFLLSHDFCLHVERQGSSAALWRKEGSGSVFCCIFNSSSLCRCATDAVLKPPQLFFFLAPRPVCVTRLMHETMQKRGVKRNSLT